MTPPAPAPPPVRTLSDVDLEMIGNLIHEAYSHRSCALDFNPQVAEALNKLTPEQIGIINRGMWLAGKASMLIGGVILTAFASALILLFSKGFWSSLAAGIKNGNP